MRENLESLKSYWSQHLILNFFDLSEKVAAGMVQRGYGRIINIGSVTAVAGYAGLGPYRASRRRTPAHDERS
jgi:short-subunit dehydrogenase